uniref:Uncharacterized protein n=1 Tax=Vespula pensylvanica TaxID=30213 RepID=A0A834PD60_VESPE|nr:hypothetical protein H0235_000092 [Vespula pensylvanica]
MSGGSAYVNTNREEAERGVEAELTHIQEESIAFRNFAGEDLFIEDESNISLNVAKQPDESSEGGGTTTTPDIPEYAFSRATGASRDEQRATRIIRVPSSNDDTHALASR